METLNYREREILRLRYGLADGYSYTLEEVGKIFSVTRERVRQIESKAVRKLQQPYRARTLASFLDGTDNLFDTPATEPACSEIVEDRYFPLPLIPLPRRNFSSCRANLPTLPDSDSSRVESELT